jgi:hypothetical protein
MCPALYVGMEAAQPRISVCLPPPAQFRPPDDGGGRPAWALRTWRRGWAGLGDAGETAGIGSRIEAMTEGAFPGSIAWKSFNFSTLLGGAFGDSVRYGSGPSRTMHVLDYAFPAARNASYRTLCPRDSAFHSWLPHNLLQRRSQEMSLPKCHLTFQLKSGAIGLAFPASGTFSLSPGAPSQPTPYLSSHLRPCFFVAARVTNSIIWPAQGCNPPQRFVAFCSDAGLS